MKTYIVETHLGAYETRAATPRKAIANVRYRVYGRTAFGKTDYWTVKEKGDNN